jgi:hypothetical protein
LSFSFSTTIFSFGKIYAAQQATNSNTITRINDPISLSLPKACVFADGLTPRDPENCVQIQNNEETGGDDNIFFNLRSDEAVDNFKCELRDRNGALVLTTILQQEDNPTDCTIDANNMEIIYKDLPDETYSFTVIATKQEETILNDNNGNTGNNVVQLTERTGKSPPFNFIVGTGSGFSGGAGFSADRRATEATPSNLETTGKTGTQGTNGVIPRLNPIWLSCNAIDTGDKIQNGLSAMKYSAYGVVSFDDFNKQLKKYNTNDFTFEVFLDFINGVIAADLYATTADIDKIPSKKNLFELDPYLRTEEQVSRHTNAGPDRFPFGIKAVDTECVYKAPPNAVSLTPQGIPVFINEEVFQHGNPPFQDCPTSNAATYTTTFSIAKDDRKLFDQGHQNVRITITQFINGNTPSYEGTLILDPYEDDEERIQLNLDGGNIVTECLNSVIF